MTEPNVLNRTYKKESIGLCMNYRKHYYILMEIVKFQTKLPLRLNHYLCISASALLSTVLSSHGQYVHNMLTAINHIIHGLLIKSKYYSLSRTFQTIDFLSFHLN